MKTENIGIAIRVNVIATVITIIHNSCSDSLGSRGSDVNLIAAIVVKFQGAGAANSSIGFQGVYRQRILVWPRCSIAKAIGTTRSQTRTTDSHPVYNVSIIKNRSAVWVNIITSIIGVIKNSGFHPTIAVDIVIHSIIHS